MNDAPIGIFDSGVGGLTVARAIGDSAARESLVYIGDTAHSPYGPKPIADVRRYSLEVLDALVDQGVKMLVIACNTASAADARAMRASATTCPSSKSSARRPHGDRRRRATDASA